MEDVLQRQPAAIANRSKGLSSAALNDWVRKIDGLIAKQRLSIFEIGDVLIKGDAELTKKDFQTIVKLSGIKSKPTALNYMRVARREILRTAGIIEFLPTTAGTLIDLAAWENDEIRESIRQRVLHPQSERAKLRAWRQQRLQPPVERPAPKAQVIAYIMCDVQEHDFDRVYKLREKFDEMKMKFLDDDMFITPWENDVLAMHRTTMLANRICDAYSEDPTLFVNPAFHKFVEEKRLGKRDSGTDLYMRDIAPLIASGDHHRLHKKIRFSKSDWAHLGVTDVGFATLLPFLLDDCPIEASG
jgi:hypothetical protein